MPKNDLEIRLITSPEVIKVPRVKSFAGTEQRSSKKAPEPEGAEFIIYNPVLKKEFRFNDVTEFSVAKEGKTISILQNIPDTLKISKICVTLFNTRELNSLLN